MADQKISGLPADAAIGGSEQIPVNDAGTNKRVTIDQIVTYVDAIVNTLIDAKGNLIVGSADDTPDILGIGSDDYFLVADSGESLGMLWRALLAADMPSGIDVTKLAAGSVDNTEFGYLDGVTSAIQTQLDAKSDTGHASDHATGGSDAFAVTDLLDAIARIHILDSGISIGKRRKINFVPGTNVSFDITDDGDSDEQVSVEISAEGVLVGTDEFVKVGSAGTADYLNSDDFEQSTGDHVEVRRDTFQIAKGVDNNLLINGGFQINQNGTQFTAATPITNSDDTYISDGWILLSDGADIVDVQNYSTPYNQTHRSNHYELFTVATALKQFGIVQLLESNVLAKNLGSAPEYLTISFKALSPDSLTLRVALIRWAGTLDTMTSDVVATWAGGGTAPTLATNWNYLSEGSEACALTSNWETYSATYYGLTGLSWADLNNFGVFIWLDDTDASVSDEIYITDIKLEVGEDATEFLPRPDQEELLRCQRYFWKTFDQGVQPQQNSADTNGVIAYNAQLAGVNDYGLPVRFPVVMRSAPSVTFYNPSAANAKWRNATGGADSGTAAVSLIGDSGCFITNPQDAADAVGDIVQVHMTADARL